MAQRAAISHRLGQPKVSFLSQRDNINLAQILARLTPEEVLGINLMNQLVNEDFLDSTYKFLNLYEMLQ